MRDRLMNHSVYRPVLGSQRVFRASNSLAIGHHEGTRMKPLSRLRDIPPNKALQPTPFAVTARALLPKTECSNQSARSTHARAAPAKGVADL